MILSIVKRMFEKSHLSSNIIHSSFVVVGERRRDKKIIIILFFVRALLRHTKIMGLPYPVRKGYVECGTWLICKENYSKESLVSSYIAVSHMSFSPKHQGRIYSAGSWVERLALLSRSNANSSAEKQRDAPLRVFIAG